MYREQKFTRCDSKCTVDVMYEVSNEIMIDIKETV